MNGLLDFITTVFVAAGGGSAVAVWLCKLFGEKWLNTKFEERLASLRHEHQKEIERLRLRINTLMDRTTKLHQREFDVLPETWGRINDAYAKICGGMFRFDPNLDKLTQPQLDHFLSNSPLADWEKTELKAAGDKTRYYIDRIVLHEMNDTLSVYNGYGLFVRKNGIFIERGLLEKFHEIEKLMIEALAEQKMNLNRQTWKQEKQAALEKEGRPLLDALEREVQARLWTADAIQ